jgi:hypothetical protein
MRKNGLIGWPRVVRPVQEGGEGLEKRRIRHGVNDVKTAVARSREERELRGLIASQLTEVLTELERLRPPREAPAEVASFVSAAERTLAVLHEGAQAEEEGPRRVAPPPAPGSDDRDATGSVTEHR